MLFTAIHVGLLDFCFLVIVTFFFLTFCNYFAAEFLLPFSSPPHFLSCSPVTLINFWPVDSAWVLLLKCAAAATAAALPHFFFLFVSLFSFTWDHFLLSLWLFPLMHSLKECFDPKWVEWDKPWNFQQSWILCCVLFLEYVFFMELTGVSCRPTNAYQSLSFKSLCFWVSVDPSECILNAFGKTEIELDMDLIQFQEWHSFADKAVIWFDVQPCTLECSS